MKTYLVTTYGFKAVSPNSPESIGRSMKTYLVAPTKNGDPNNKASDIGIVGTAVRAGGLRLRLLLSYFYFKDFDLDNMVENIFDGAAEVDVFVDSGAFSAAAGSPIDPNLYIAWVKKWQHRITVASAPDVIGDPVATERDTKLMLKAGLTTQVLPVYHVGEPWDVLQKMAKQHPYIALGGMVPFAKRGKFLSTWCRKAFTFIPKETKVHGFGMTNWTTMQAFPWYSVDSSSWTSGVRYGQFSLFDRGKMVDIDMRDRKLLLQESELLRRYGLTARNTVSRGQEFDRDAIIRANLLSWQAAEDWMNR